MATGQTITLRLTIADPLVGVAYSLQDKNNQPIGPIVAGDEPISFDVAVRVAPGPKFLGDFVRREGPTRRFIYLAIGEQPGQRPSFWSRRAKIDAHTLPADLLERPFGRRRPRSPPPRQGQGRRSGLRDVAPDRRLADRGIRAT